MMAESEKEKAEAKVEGKIASVTGLEVQRLLLQRAKVDRARVDKTTASRSQKAVVALIALCGNAVVCGIATSLKCQRTTCSRNLG